MPADQPATAPKRPPIEAPGPATVDALFTLKDKVALLTDVGGTGSKEVAQLLADAGAKVVIADRAFAAAKSHAAEINEAGGKAVAKDVDIESEAAVIALFEEVVRELGQLDIVVNCVGMHGARLVTETSAEQWDAMHSVNLRSTFFCVREAVKHMSAAGRGGRIVNITTIGTQHPVRRGNAAYGSSRLAVTALSRNVALDHLHEGILVNIVHAGGIAGKCPDLPQMPPQTPAVKPPFDPAGGGTRMPFGGGHMVDVAAAVLYLVSPAGRYMTGQSVIVDGGFLLT